MSWAVLRALDAVGLGNMPIAGVLVSAVTDFNQTGLVALNVSWKWSSQSPQRIAMRSASDWMLEN
jgi:hypothetical protein